MVKQEQSAILQRNEALDGLKGDLEGEKEQVPEADVAFSFELLDPVRGRIESRSSTSLSIKTPSESVRLRSTR